ncbi:MAG: LytR/AlgR family response regulator transcription factor [Salibacteraceae bacterium]
MDSPQKILIVEDEFLTIKNLWHALEAMGYQVVGFAKRASEAIALLETKEIDLAILDIHIKGEQDGIWLAAYLKENFDIPFLFLTAFGDRQTIQNAVAIQPYAYLIKPFRENELYSAIELAITNFQSRPQLSKSVSSTNAPPVKKHPESIFMKGEDLFVRIVIADIQYLEAQKNYIRVVLDDKEHRVRSSMREFMDQLPEEEFLQCHRSFSIRKSAITSVGANFLLLGNLEIPVGRSFKEAVQGALNIGR